MTSSRNFPTPPPLRAGPRTHTHASWVPNCACVRPSRAALLGAARSPAGGAHPSAGVRPVPQGGRQPRLRRPAPAGHSWPGSEGKKEMPPAGGRTVSSASRRQRGCPGPARPSLTCATLRARGPAVRVAVAWRCLSHRKWKTRSSAAGAAHGRSLCPPEGQAPATAAAAGGAEGTGNLRAEEMARDCQALRGGKR